MKSKEDEKIIRLREALKLGEQSSMIENFNQKNYLKNLHKKYLLKYNDKQDKK